MQSVNGTGVGKINSGSCERMVSGEEKEGVLVRCEVSKLTFLYLPTCLGALCDIFLQLGNSAIKFKLK